MSTSYKKFKYPVTSINRKNTIIGGHKRLNIFINHQNAGSLVVYLGAEEQDFINALLKDDPVVTVIVTKDGPRVKFNRHGLSPSTQLVSEYGTFTTVAELEKTYLPFKQTPNYENTK